MPHAVAFSMMHTISKTMTPYAAGALKDMTRITLSPVNIWMDIFFSNKKEILKAICELEKSLEIFKTALAKNDSQQLSRFLAKASQKRRSIPSHP